MGLRILTYFFYMMPVLGSFMKDLMRRDLSFSEVRTNYLLGKANAFERAGLFEHAVIAYESILKRDGGCVPVLLNLGGLYYRRGKYEAALPYYESVIRANPKHYLGHYWLAMCYFNLGRYYGAINTLEEVIEFLPTFKDALNLIGQCYERIGEGAKAEHYYLQAIRADSSGMIMHAGILSPQTRHQKEVERVKH